MGLLRFFLAGIVLLSHFPYREIIDLYTANVAVYCFFIISGFYIQLLLARGDIRVADFYFSRALRIYPLYWLFALITFLAFRALYPLPPDRPLLFAVLFIFTNVTLLGQDLLRILHPYSNLAVLGQAWTLSIELVFYALAPFLLRQKTRWIVLEMALSTALNFYLLSRGLYGSPWFSALFPSVLMFFLAGALGYRAYRRYLEGRDRSALAGAVCSILLPLIGYVLTGCERDDIRTYYIAVGATCLLVPFLFHLSKESRFDRWVGNLSYPIYISHLTIILFVSRTFENHALGAAAIIAGTLLVSIVAYHAIEKPIDDFRHKRFPTH